VSLTLLVLSPELEGVALDFFSFFFFSPRWLEKERDERKR
jgi:hypothetical protein